MASPQQRVLVEHENPRIRQRQVEALEAAGFDVDACAGPNSFLGKGCPLTADGDCEKAAAADVVLNGLPLIDIKVYIALRATFPELPVLLAMTDAERRRVPVLEEIGTVTPRNLHGHTLVEAVYDALALEDGFPR